MSLMFFLTTLSFGQKVNFKNIRCNAQKCNLPTHKVAEEDRNYSLEVKGLYSGMVDPEKGRLYGWTRVDNNPTVHGVVSIYGFSYGRPKLKTEKKEKKDKDGKVIDKWNEYNYTVTSKGRATMYVYGPRNPFKYQMTDRQKKKAKEAEEAAAAKKAAEEKAVSDNPFLKDVDVEPAGDDEQGADEGADIELELLERVSIDQEETFKTPNKKTVKAVSEILRNDIRDDQYQFKEAYPGMAFRSGVYRLNNAYGFRPVKSYFTLQGIKTGDIREVENWNNAVTAAKTIMASLRYNTDLNQTRSDMQPILDFFHEVMSSYSLEDRKERKVSKAAFENIMYLQSYLDMHDDVIAMGNKYIDDKKLDRICKRAIKKAERFKAHLAFLEMPFRHLPSGQDIEGDEIEEEEEIAADGEGE